MKKTILLIDNYDSFTYNLVQIFEELGTKVTVKPNTQITHKDLHTHSHLVISPGAGVPNEAGDILQIIKECANTHHILGVCLGHQAIAEAFGGKLYNLANVQHGQKADIFFTKNDFLNKNIPQNTYVGLYHSWAVLESSLKNTPLEAFAYTSELKNQQGEHIIQAILHKDCSIRGIQFHPESFITEFGYKLLENWLNLSLK